MYDKYDAMSDAASDERAAIIKECIAEDSVFAWKWRIVESMKNKNLPWKRYKHLEKYCEMSITEALEAKHDAADEARDPYGYRGLRRSDFL